ncbi:allophanate hydrolase [Candidatus Francisella endociliophora]|uniref:Allophanate hydrolase n=1 Tax=Candidatus Francisella endociliophora TaxID=653937 RepID=A0A097EQ19_9GAMM|nr:carboxyltransferase domain-containing protein [Francisella sp. FSC1006]AIT09662.1 allophanate hydrolase [Francisella sp. FSC1006]
MEYHFLNESCFIYKVSDRLCLEDNLVVLSIYKEIIKDSEFCSKYQIFDIVPTYNSIAFHFDYDDLSSLKEAILTRIKIVDYSQQLEPKTHYIAVKYNGEDLQKASGILGLSESEIIKRHTQVEYHIAMLGFKPYFPYLLGLDKSINLPRLATPRNRIPAGSIGIGGSQTTIFPEQSPSGWNIIGHSDFRDFKSFCAGDKIIFKEI